MACLQRIERKWTDREVGIYGIKQIIMTVKTAINEIQIVGLTDNLKFFG